jgi:hypothetical protein
VDDPEIQSRSVLIELDSTEDNEHGDPPDDSFFEDQRVILGSFASTVRLGSFKIEVRVAFWWGVLSVNTATAMTRASCSWQVDTDEG